MLGVVVWAAEEDQSAIVWCEDQGDLAFIEMCSHSSAVPERFGKGDLITFDLEVHADLRLAQNPRRIARHYCVGLEEVVAQANALTPAAKEANNNVVSLASVRDQRKRSVA